MRPITKTILLILLVFVGLLFGAVRLDKQVKGILQAANGGLGIDTSASTGVPQVTAGTWAIVAGTGDDFAGSFATPTELTIATGSITISTSGAYDVDTESDAASDDLTAMTCTAGVSFALRAESDARSVVLDSSSYQVVGATDQTLDQDGDIALGFCAVTDTPVIYAFADEAGTFKTAQLETTGTGPLEITAIASPGAHATSGACNFFVDSADDLLKIHCNGGSESVFMTDLDDATITADYDFGGGTLQVPNSTTLPGTCEVGDVYQDSDAPTGQQIYACESANTWVLQGGGGGDGYVSTLYPVLAAPAGAGFYQKNNAGTNPLFNGSAGNPPFARITLTHNTAQTFYTTFVLNPQYDNTRNVVLTFYGAGATASGSGDTYDFSGDIYVYAQGVAIGTGSRPTSSGTVTCSADADNVTDGHTWATCTLTPALLGTPTANSAVKILWDRVGVDAPGDFRLQHTSVLEPTT